MNVLTHPAAEAYAAHVNPALVKLLGALGQGRVLVRAKGTSLWDEAGREYLDFAAESAAFGHNAPELLDAARDALGRDAPSLRADGVAPHVAELAEDLARAAAPLARVTLAASRSEAVDAALKLARAATRRRAVLYARGGFHGAGVGALSILGSGRLRDPFEPLLPDCYEIPFDDSAALQRALADTKPAAFVVEPVQAEGGVAVPHHDYLRDARKLCKKTGALLVLDEATTGLGRAGSTFAHEGDGFSPDVVVVGEALGGGLVPLAATVASREVQDRAYGSIDRADLGGPPSAGHAIGCAVGRAALATLRGQRLAEAARDRGDQLRERLRDEIGEHPFVRAVRGRGLLVGIELGPRRSRKLLGRLLPNVVEGLGRRVLGHWLALELLDRGVVCRPCVEPRNVVLLAPPLTVTTEEIERCVAAVSDVFGQYTDVKKLLATVGQRLGSKLTGGLTS